MFRIDRLDIKRLIGGMTHELAAEIGPEPRPLPLRTADRMNTDKSPAAANVILENLPLLFGIKRLVVGIVKDQHIKGFYLVGRKNGRVVGYLAGPFFPAAYGFEAIHAGRD